MSASLALSLYNFIINDEDKFTELCQFHNAHNVPQKRNDCDNRVDEFRQPC